MHIVPAGDYEICPVFCGATGVINFSILPVSSILAKGLGKDHTSDSTPLA